MGLRSGSQRDDHRLADRPRQAEHDGGGDAGERGREDHPQRGLHPVGAERERPWRSAWGTADIASSDSDAIVGMIITPEDEASGQHADEPTSMCRQSCRMSGVTK